MAIKDAWLKWKNDRWHGMRARSVNSGVRYAHKCFESYYKNGIELRMTKSDFYRWCDENRSSYEKIKLSDQSPSIDRIDSTGHYELSNLRIIDSKTNISEGFKRWAVKRRKSVLGYKPETGEMVIYESQAQASRYGFNQGDISRAIKRKNRHKGYFWSFYGGD